MSNHEKMIDEIIHKISDEKRGYGSFLIKSFIRKQSPLWENIVTLIKPISSLDTTEDLKKLDYGDFALIEEEVSLSDILKFIQVPNKSSQIIKIGNYKVEFQIHYWEKVYTYDSAKNPFDVNWYFEIYRLDGPTKNIIYKPLIAIDLPIYPDKRKVIKDFIGINIDKFSDVRGIILILPKYEARIKELKIGLTNLSIEIEEKNIKSHELMGKVYCEKDNEIKKFDITFKNGLGSVDVGFKPDYLYFALISKSNGDILDKREFHKDWELPKGIKIDIPNYQLRELIKNGETDTVEFKGELGNPEEFAETVVSFSNSRGVLLH